MDCYRSFNITIDQNRTFNNTTSQIKNWGNIGNYHWVVVEDANSFFEIQGFKRIDLYGIEMVGYIQTTLGANDGGIVTDYSFKIGIGGQNPLVSGNVRPSPNDWGISTGVGQYQLGKYSNKITFETPFTGVTALQFAQLKVQGQNGETLNSLNLDINLVFNFLYKFDGE